MDKSMSKNNANHFINYSIRNNSFINTTNRNVNSNSSCKPYMERVSHKYYSNEGG